MMIQLHSTNRPQVIQLAVDNMMASDIETTKVRTHCIQNPENTPTLNPNPN